METIPTVGRITVRYGVAGEIQYTTRVTYPDEPSRKVTFSGNTAGSPGPIVMITPSGQTFVTNPGRFGARLDRGWVLAFFNVESET